MTDFTIPIILLFLFICGLEIDIRRMKKQIKELQELTEKRYDGLTYDETILRLLFLIAKQKFGNYDGNQRAYMHRLEKELFSWKGDV